MTSDERPADEAEAIRATLLASRRESIVGITKQEIEQRVTYHAPSPEGVERHRQLSMAAASFMAVVSDVCPEGREKSLAITKIEEAKMWASASVARNPETVMSGRQFLTPAVAHAELDTLLSLFSGMLEGYPGDGREFMTIAETEAIARLCSRAFLRLAKDCGADRALVEADMKEWNEVILEEVGKMQAEREAESPR